MSLALFLLLLLAPLAAPQERDAQRLKPLIPAPPAGAQAGAQAGSPQQPAASQTAQQPAQQPGQAGALRPDSGWQALPADDGAGPRPLPVQEPLPFTSDRPLFTVDGVPISAGELNELVLYYRSFRSGAPELLLVDAVAALLPSKVMQARFGAELPKMRARADAAQAALAAGRPFAEVVKEFSDDDEAEDPEGKYEFGRERAVQPFDRASFTLEPGSGLQGPFLTVYGWHWIEPLAYARGATAKEDRATMRHLLVMYPRLRELDAAGEDVRAWIREQVAAARIRVLEPGLANLIPPERRAQIVP